MKKTLMLLFVVITALSCNKETTIKNNLWKQGGDWNISSYTYNYGSMNPSSPSYPSYPQYLNDCGNFHFSKDGTGTMTLIEDGETYAAAFKYTNSENELTLIFDGSYAQVYKMDWSKNKVTITYNNDHKDPDGYTYYDNEKYILIKK
jgi:hypothetical protein